MTAFSIVRIIYNVTFPGGRSALKLVAARLRYVAATVWGEKRYLDMKRLRELEEEQRNATRELIA